MANDKILPAGRQAGKFLNRCDFLPARHSLAASRPLIA